MSNEGDHMEGLEVACNHSLGNDPRRRERGECMKCGRVLGDGWIRDEEREGALILRHTEHVPLAAFAMRYMQSRAGVDSEIHHVAHRDFHKECMEEYVDAVAYLVFRSYQRKIHGYEDDLSSGESMALYHTLEAIRCLQLDTDD